MTALSPRIALLMTLPPLMWAGNAVVGRLMVGQVPPMALNALRWALAAAFKWQSKLGREKVARRIHGLAQRLKDGIADHVRLVTPRSPEVSSGLVCLDVDGMRPEDAVERLAEQRVRASVTPYADQHVRLGTSLHVDERDVDAAVTAIKALRG